MDAKIIECKVVGEQDIHTASKYHPTDYLLSAKEKCAFIMDTSLTKWSNDTVVRQTGINVPLDVVLEKYLSALLEQNYMIMKSK